MSVEPANADGTAALRPWNSVVPSELVLLMMAKRVFSPCRLRDAIVADEVDGQFAVQLGACIVALPHVGEGPGGEPTKISVRTFTPTAVHFLATDEKEETCRP